MRFKKEPGSPGEYVSNDGKYCLQCPNKINPNNPNKQYYAFRCFYNNYYGPFNSIKEAEKFINKYLYPVTFGGTYSNSEFEAKKISPENYHLK